MGCSWCDTKYAWRKGESFRISDVLERLRALGVPGRLLVVTGGEPLLQILPLSFLLKRVADIWGCSVEIETAGAISPKALLDGAYGYRFIVSPKLSSSGVPLEKRIRAPVLREFSSLPGTEFKFVVSSGDDLEEVAGLVTLVGVRPSSVWIMPEGTDPARLSRVLREVALPTVRRGWNLTTRLQILSGLR